MAITLNRQLALVLAVAVPAILVVILLFLRVGFPRFNAVQETLQTGKIVLH